MKKKYIAPETEIILLNTVGNVMDEENPVNPYSDTTNTYEGNETVVEIEDDEWLNQSKSLWDN